MSPQVPNIVAIVPAVVLLISLLGVNVAPEDVQKVIEAVSVIIVAGASVWSWFSTKKLVTKIGALSAVAVPVAPKKKKVTKKK